MTLPFTLKPSLLSYIEGRNNNFNLLRMIGALTIMFAHAMFITIGDDINFETYPVKYTLGITTLNLFFVLSGMLVTASWMKHSDVITYAVSRIMRIIPGLMVVSFFLPFVLGPFVTKLPLNEYFTNPSVWLYWPATTLLNPDMNLPGVYEGMPNDAVINAPLWTLRYEAFLYAGVAIIGLLGWLRVQSRFLIFAGVALCVYFGVTHLTSLRSIAAIDHLMHFGYAFLVGSAFHIFRDKVSLDLRLGFLGLGLALFVVWQFGLEMGEFLLIPSAAILGCWLAYVPGGVIRYYNGLGDYSYGLYIWHYPIEQLFCQIYGTISASNLFLISLPFALFAAILSWHFIERPALASIKIVVGFFKTFQITGLRS